MNTKVKYAIDFMLRFANDPTHGYDQTHRWGEYGDYDCSSLVITAFEAAGIPLKTKGATYTGNMRTVCLQCGFTDMTKSVNLSSGIGIKAGDILLHEQHHVALAVEDNGKTICHASINEKGTARGGKPGDQTGREICTRTYYNKPWTHILRYTADDAPVVLCKYKATGVTSVSDYLNVRSAPTMAAEVVAQFAPGDTVYITGKTNNGWYRCGIWNGTQAYVDSVYVRV